MKLGKFSGIITSMFTDEMDIYRYEDVTNEDATTDTKLSETPVQKEVPCRISFSADENPRDVEVDNVPIRLAPKIFCSLNTNIRAGDYVILRRYNDDGYIVAIYSGNVGLPSVFSTHKEALFSIERST